MRDRSVPGVPTPPPESGNPVQSLLALPAGPDNDAVVCRCESVEAPYAEAGVDTPACPGLGNAPRLVHRLLGLRWRALFPSSKGREVSIATQNLPPS